MIDQVELTKHVRELSLSKFDQSFDQEAVWNSRLRTTGGRFFQKDSHLDFNPKLVDHPDFDKVILHELCHYHLYRAGKGYRHVDQDFKQLLATVGGLRFAPQMEASRRRLIYTCRSCGQVYLRNRRINTKKYRCGRCGNCLIFRNLEIKG